ncbi:hypothetical protein [Leptolyngbya sp. NIES-2104]|uniref:hypothetical protein n=1 Tax=Leptolyngbya sp. NIES-2104 TaxID=1552121 RepID=UPI0006ECA660|nr:hypothetical protein [Leptolyngbya sp. NIES-2104]GAP95302.1 hypothetical protein NIES2104_18220 [Leptolyngbya sp. NIES-2104]
MSVSNDRFTYPSAEVLVYMEQQAEEFERMRSQLVETHLNQYVWFEGGQVLDADENSEALAIRVCREDENRPLFIKKVVFQDPQPVVRTPFR